MLLQLSGSCSSYLRCPLALLIGAGRGSTLDRLSLSARGSGLALPAVLLGRLGSLGSGVIGRALLQLLGNGVLVVASIGLLAGGHRDVELIGVTQSILVGHQTGVGVAGLVRVHTSVVQAQVVLVSAVPALQQVSEFP